jgi:hypothetical protein
MKLRINIKLILDYLVFQKTLVKILLNLLFIRTEIKLQIGIVNQEI